MADFFVGPAMEKLIDACFEYLEDQVRWQTGMKEELQRLRDILPNIQAVVSAYSQEQIGDQNDHLNKWLWKLRDAIDEADDVLDLIEYRKREKQVSNKKKDDVLDLIEYRKLEKQASKKKKLRRVRSIMKSMKKKLLKIVKRALKIDPDLESLEKAVQKLVEISAEVSTFLPLLESEKHVQENQQSKLDVSRETGSLPTDVLLGRRDDMNFVAQWLTEPSKKHQTQITGTDRYKNISVLSVVGHGGMGKTTLLQHVYEIMKNNEFDVKIWVCVSNNFVAKKVIADMLESIEEKRPDLGTLEALQSSLRSKVKSKKFLLVLDDVWEESDGELRNVLAPFADGNFGSKILVTTRMESVASMIAMVIGKDKKILPIKGLEEDECLQLLITHAFAGVKNHDEHQKLRSIAEKMVKKLLGSPLAAKVIGGVLRGSLDEKYWNTVLNSNYKSAGLGHNNIMHILRLSYIFLSKPLQNCFAFCCTFRQDYKFDKDGLVRRWIALGFIQPPSNSRETREIIESTGRNYFDILVNRSFFDEVSSGRYKMHDLLHELAQSISAQESFRSVEDEQLFSINPETIRHLAVETDNLEVLKHMTNFKKLRSLHLDFYNEDYSEEENQDFVNILTEIIEASKSLRVLDIDARRLKPLPESIGHLMHLRYLGFNTFMFPRFISKLYHILFIIYNDYDSSSYIFEEHHEVEINKDCQLILNILRIRDPSELLMQPLRNITSLKHLFVVDNDQVVSFPIEAEQWFLQVSSSLSGLLFRRLKFLQSLPSSLESLYSLDTLLVSEVPQLQELPNIPASLEYLLLEELESLQRQPSLSTISSLQELNLRTVPLLKSLPDLPLSLRTLHLEDLENLDCPPSCLSGLSSLDTFIITKVPQLRKLPDLPLSLRTLHLEDLENLDCLPSFLSGLSSLDTFIIRKVPQLRELPDLPLSLRKLHLEELKNLDCLPSCLSGLSSLDTFIIKKVPQLRELPDLPLSLDLGCLLIEECHPNLMKRYQDSRVCRL